MADIISREKEFRKLNEQLDDEFKRSALNKIEKFSESADARQIPLNSRRNDSQKFNIMNNDRFTTYTKSKGQGSSCMKKNGGGDFISPPKSPIQKSRKENYGIGFNKNTIKSNSPRADIFMSTSTSRKQRKSCGSEEPFRGTTTIIGINQSNSTRKIGSPNGPIMVKYHNFKFSSSPSLDDIIKDSLEKLEGCNEFKEETANIPSNDSNHSGQNHLSPNLLECHNVDGKNVKKIVNTNGLIRFLKSKIALLEENQVKSMQDMAQQKEAFDEVNERLKLTKQQRDKALLKNSTLSEQLEKLTNQLNEANRRSRERSQESIDQHKELASIKRDLKQLTLAHRSLDTRYSRTQEELEAALKSQEFLKNNERQLKEKLRHHTDAKDAEIKYLKKQRSDLFTAYKRQLYLIDNLRQQNICMEQAKMIDFSEKEFSKVLEWNLRT